MSIEMDTQRARDEYPGADGISCQFSTSNKILRQAVEFQRDASLLGRWSCRGGAKGCISDALRAPKLIRSWLYLEKSGQTPRCQDHRNQPTHSFGKIA